MWARRIFAARGCCGRINRVLIRPTKNVGSYHGSEGLIPAFSLPRFMHNSKPVEAVPVSAKPVEAVPVSAKPVEAVPVSAKPVEALPVSTPEAKPVEAVSTPEAKPVEAVPVSTPEVPQSNWNPLLPQEIEAFAALANADLVQDIARHCPQQQQQQQEQEQEQQQQQQQPVSQFLILPEPLKWMWEYRHDLVAAIYNRDCYVPLVDLITKHLDEDEGKGRGVVITGTPGIGKTGFLWYLLWSSLKQRRDVVLAIAGRYYVLQWKDKQLEVKLTRNVDLVARTFAGTRPWFLADKVVPEESRIFPFKFILTCSPRKSSAGELKKGGGVREEMKKGGGVRELYVPTWGEKELCKLSRLFGQDDEVVRKKFTKWGGIPRFVLDKVQPGDQEILQKAISVTAQQDVGKLRFNENLIAIPDELSHKVFHCKPADGDFTRVRHFPASSYVVEQLLKLLPESPLEQFLHNPAHEQLVDVQGAMWEKYAVAYLELGGPLKIRTLAGAAKAMTLPGAKGLQVLPSTYIPVVRSKGRTWKYDTATKKAIGTESFLDSGKDAEFGIQVIQLPVAVTEDLVDTLITPASRTNPVWDALKGNTMYQMTVSATRTPMKADSFQLRETFRFMDMVCGAGCEKELVYVVPRCVFPIFTVKDSAKLKVTVATIPAKVPSLSAIFQDFFGNLMAKYQA